MAERKDGDSSDSEAYMSADEGLTSSRSSEKGSVVDSTKGNSLCVRDLKDHEEKNGQESGSEGKRNEDQPSRTECEESQTNEELVNCVSREVDTKELEGDGTKEAESHQEKEIRVEGEEKQPPGEGDGNLEGEREKTPIPPPRRKRKKKLKRNPSLEKATGDVRIQRSMTVGSVDMFRERPSSSQPPLPSSPLTPSHPTPDTCTTSSPINRDSVGEGEEGETVVAVPSQDVRGKEVAESPKAPHHNRTTISSEVEGPLGNSNGPHTSKKAPSISIEPDTSLELTEEMVHGRNNVMTRDTPFAKASGSDKHETGIIFDSDDESFDGVYGSQELRDHSDLDGDTETRDAGQSSDVVREVESEKTAGGEWEQKETTPVARETEGGEEDDGGRKTGKVAPSPSDNQILQMTIVKNLDTGDSFPLSVVDEKIPLGSPLNLHLYRRTAAMENPIDEGSGEEGHHRRRPHLKKKLRHFLGKKKIKQNADAMGRTETVSRGHVTGTQEPDTTIKYKPCSHHKGPYDFDKVRLKQDLTGPHLGAVWVMEFSICGRLLAVAGQDSIVRVWVLRTASQFFHELQAKYQKFGIHSSGESLAEKASVASTNSSEEDDTNAAKGPFLEVPICMYHGHSADILDLSWSKNFFLLSSSMDKTVRLWHISRKECLCCFQHVDFVTAIAFHPRDDRYFLSGSLDGKLRLWNIPDKRVALWNEIEGVGSHLITAANFCMNGKLAVAGTYDGRCIFYETEHLKYHTQIHVRSKHGKNRGRKISGIEPLPGEDKILVTSNDSRLRLYNLKDHSLSCKYKGCLNTSSQIRATFSRDGLNIICGSEDNFIYVWKTHHDVNKLSSVRRDRNEFYESFTTHQAPVTAAVFAPVPGITVDQGLKEVGQMIIAADYQGGIKVYVNSEKL